MADNSQFGEDAVAFPLDTVKPFLLAPVVKSAVVHNSCVLQGVTNEPQIYSVGCKKSRATKDTAGFFNLMKSTLTGRIF